MANLDENSLNIYTDGSQKNNPRRGGLAYRFVLIDEKSGDENPVDFSLGCYRGATNNAMELLVCIESLKTVMRDGVLSAYLNRSKKAVIYTDSDYIKKYYQYAFYEWSVHDWTKAEGGPVSNIPLWKELNRLRRKLYRETGKLLHFEKVKAHQKGSKKDIHNDAVDKLAGQAALSRTIQKTDLIKFTDVRKRGTTNKTVIGSVKAICQTIGIYVVTDKIMNRGLYQYSYRIISKDSLDYDKVDVATSELILNAGHYYTVTLNDEEKNPRILESHEMDRPESQ